MRHDRLADRNPRRPSQDHGVSSSSAVYLEERRPAYPAVVHAERLKICRIEDNIELTPPHNDAHSHYAFFGAVAGHGDLDVGRSRELPRTDMPV
jgi:hypothetical protein